MLAFACNRPAVEVKCLLGTGIWTTQVPHLPLFTQQVRTLGAETLVGMGNSGLALVHLQLFP